MTIALLGAETLLGREIRDVLQKQAPAIQITPYPASAESNFGEQDGETVFIEAFDASAAKKSDVVILAGTEEGALKAYAQAKKLKGRLVLIDCSGHLEQKPEARIAAPLPGETAPPLGWLFVTAQPSAVAIAMALQRLHRSFPIARATLHVFEPASERGKGGAAELHQQTTALLAFKPIEKKYFDAQLAFNVLPRYGEDAPVPLASIEQRLEHHVATLLHAEPGENGPPPMPSIRLLQAPVFHGYSLSFWIEFADAIPNAGALGEALASAQIEVRSAGQEFPNNVEAAGQSGLIAGDIRIDHNNPHAAWLWIVCDNLRVTADLATAILTSLKTEPAG